MIPVAGLVLGSGMVFVLAPWLWPRAQDRPRPRRSAVMVIVRDRLVQAGLPGESLATVVIVSIIVAVAAGVAVLALVPVGAVGIAAAVIMLVLPALVIARRARRARRAARQAWPDVVDHLVSAVRSGLALPDGVVTLAHTGPAETRSAFERFESEYRASGNFAGSLDLLKDRLSDPVADRIIETLRMSREVGGNELITVLRNLGAYLRQEASIRNEVEARQSWTVNAARLGVAAPWVVLVLLTSRPEAATAYNTSAGTALIVAGFGITVIAYRLMLRVGRLPEERRWFS